MCLKSVGQFLVAGSWVDTLVGLAEVTNDAMISKADKGNSIVILYLEDYHRKVQNFIDNNNFVALKKDPTKKFHNKVGILSCNIPVVYII